MLADVGIESTLAGCANTLFSETREAAVYCAIIKPESVGYEVMADIFIDVEPGHVREVAELVAELPQVTYVACAAGESDVSISLRVRSIKELFNFVNEKIGKIPGVRRTQSYILPLKIKDLDTWLPPNVLETIRNDKVTNEAA